MSKDDEHYAPIPCAVYSDYELAIMHRQRLRLAWRDGEGKHLAILLPLDLQTRSGAEFLIAQRATGETLSLRLDRILSSTPA